MSGHARYPIQICRQTGERQSEVMELLMLGNYYTRLGQPGRAMSHYKESLRASKAKGGHSGEINGLILVGSDYIERHDLTGRGHS